MVVRGGTGGGYGDAERYIRLVSERDLQPGYPLTGCVLSGANIARGRGGSLINDAGRRDLFILLHNNK